MTKLITPLFQLSCLIFIVNFSVAEQSKLEPPRLHIKDSLASGSSVPLISHKIEANISGVACETRTSQTYVNQDQSPINVSYRFPVGTQSAISSLEMRIGDRLILGIIKEKQEAARVYSQAVSNGQRAALLTQIRPNLFDINIGQIQPGDTIKIQIKAIDQVPFENGMYEFVQPMAITPRYDESKPRSESSGTSPEYVNETSYSHSLSVNINCPIPIETISSPSHKLSIEHKSSMSAVASISSKDENPGNRDFILRYKLNSNRLLTGTITSSFANENYFCTILHPPSSAPLEDVKRREFVFIVDISGSMTGHSLNTAKHLMGKILDDLDPQDRFNIIPFESTCKLMSDQFLKPTRKNLEWAFRNLEQEWGSGGTRLKNAIDLAATIPQNMRYQRTTLILTDGAISAEKDCFEAIRQDLNISNFYTIGAGYSPNRYLLEGIASAGNGDCYVAIDTAEANQIAIRFAKENNQPILTNLEISGEHVELYDVIPSKIPALLSSEPIVILGKYKNNQLGTIALKGLSSNGLFYAKYPVTSTLPSMAVSTVWARQKVKELIDYSAVTDENQRLVTGLGLKHSIATEFTSFVAVDSAVNPTSPTPDYRIPNQLPKGTNSLALSQNSQASEAAKKPPLPAPKIFYQIEQITELEEIEEDVEVLEIITAAEMCCKGYSTAMDTVLCLRFYPKLRRTGPKKLIGTPKFSNLARATRNKKRERDQQLWLDYEAPVPEPESVAKAPNLEFVNDIKSDIITNQVQNPAPQLDPVEYDKELRSTLKALHHDQFATLIYSINESGEVKSVHLSDNESDQSQPELLTKIQALGAWKPALINKVPTNSTVQYSILLN